MKADGELAALKDMVSRFARDTVAPRADLRDLITFPPELHDAFERQGLFGIGIPAAYGGMGGGWLHLSAAGQALAEHGGSLGTALSWLMHCLISRFVILGFGTDGQKISLLPGLASGEKVPCLAISEPGVGGHPKRLTTAALRQGTSFSITGEKAYLTNGPIADLFVVLAITAQEGERKSYTAFLVPSDTPGLKKTPPMDLGFLRPCPHGGVALDGCVAGEDRVVGREGCAYPDIAMGFREVEDVMMMAPFIGGTRAQIRMIASAVRERGVEPGREVAAAMGEAVAGVSVLEVLSRDAAGMLDTEGPGHPGLLPMVLFMRQSAQGIARCLNGVVEKAGVAMGLDFTSLTNDLVSSMKIAGNVARIKQERLGRSVLS
jgi:alkylation response protein AidB-like acyl-CoA dehydrogenase